MDVSLGHDAILMLDAGLGHDATLMLDACLRLDAALMFLAELGHVHREPCIWEMRCSFKD